MVNLRNIRRDYHLMELSKRSVSPEPFKQFEEWLAEAISAGVPEPTAMVLTTVSAEGKPSSRVVLLKQSSGLGFDFFTNYQSKKGKQLKENHFAAVIFFWPEMERQVRIEGSVQKLDHAESDDYFKTRPLQSQIGSWASPQSAIIPNRKTLIDWFEEFESIFKITHITRPPHWGGYRLVPELFEFWQGRENRLHDRIEYIKENGEWKFHRLAP
jgi:pyridoxamine 5'-phosphate oxidase